MRNYLNDFYYIPIKNLFDNTSILKRKYKRIRKDCIKKFGSMEKASNEWQKLIKGE